MGSLFQTVGSSGVGTLAKDQDQQEVLGVIDSIAGDLEGFGTRFIEIRRFPDTDIFYLAPEFPDKFWAIQDAIVATDLRFEESPFPYTPHCTIRSVGQVSREEETQLLPLEPPTESFRLEVLSIYELVNNRECNLLHRISLQSES